RRGAGPGVGPVAGWRSGEYNKAHPLQRVGFDFLTTTRSPVSLQLDHLGKSYPTRGGPLTVLRDVTLELPRGESLAVTGPSGSGKSTLLHLLGTLDRPTAGTVRLDGRDPFALPEPELADFRNRHVGFVFQDHHLLPQCTVLENVLIPTLIHRGEAKDADAWAKELLKRVGLAERVDHRPAARAEAAGGPGGPAGGGGTGLGGARCRWRPSSP